MLLMVVDYVTPELPSVLERNENVVNIYVLVTETLPPFRGNREENSSSLNRPINFQVVCSWFLTAAGSNVEEFLNVILHTSRVKLK